jgi:transposase
MSIMENAEGKKPRPRRGFTAEFKIEIVEKRQRGNDRSIGQDARAFDLSETAGRQWVIRAEWNAGHAPTG